MMLIGILHIAFLVSSYPAYLYITLKSLSGKTPRRLLLLTNIAYITGLILGILWAKIEWGFYLSLDIKTILSLLLPLPFIAEGLGERKNPILPCTGSLLIALNYVLPLLVGSIHNM